MMAGDDVSSYLGILHETRWHPCQFIAYLLFTSFMGSLKTILTNTNILG